MYSRVSRPQSALITTFDHCFGNLFFSANELYASPSFLIFSLANSSKSISNFPKISTASFIKALVSGTSNAFVTVASPPGVSRLQLRAEGAAGALVYSSVEAASWVASSGVRGVEARRERRAGERVEQARPASERASVREMRLLRREGRVSDDAGGCNTKSLTKPT